jgi:HEPN domain-containing protein
MDKDEKYSYWLDTAEYDKSTAYDMFKSGRWIYAVFMCQQSLEKLSKALYVYTIDDNIPRVHNIRLIVSKVAEALGAEVPEERNAFFDSLVAYYINGRYPSYVEKIAALVGKEKAAEILENTEDAFTWLLTMKK